MEINETKDEKGCSWYILVFCVILITHKLCCNG